MNCDCGTECEYIGTNWICPKCSKTKECDIVIKNKLDFPIKTNVKDIGRKIIITIKPYKA